MPELPEVEVVRAGLARWVTGARIGAVQVLHPRPVRWHETGPDDFAARLGGAVVTDVVRRGKYLWLVLDDGVGPDAALLAHLGMSGQLLVRPAEAPDETHLRVRMRLPQGRELRFVDQRMFGGLALSPLVPTPDGRPAGVAGTDPMNGPAAVRGVTGQWAGLLPPAVAHIARDVLDPHLDRPALVARLRSRRTGLKRALLDQTLVSGIGNIYADEALWRARLHYDRPADQLSRPAAVRLLDHVADVMRQALAQGGTSFDSLYVNVNGQSGYFDRSLAVYGQQGRPCPRCGTQVRREAFMNRSSYLCPRCQARPRSRQVVPQRPRSG